MITKWTDSEKEFLFENYPNMGMKWCMEKLQNNLNSKMFNQKHFEEEKEI